MALPFPADALQSGPAAECRRRAGYGVLQRLQILRFSQVCQFVKLNICKPKGTTLCHTLSPLPLNVKRLA